MIVIDGKVTPQVSALDRGLAYGDGLFETMAVQGGRVRFWTAHWQRLEQGSRALSIPFDISLFQREAKNLLEQCEHDRHILKLILTRGCGGRGYKPPPQPRATRILQLHAWPSAHDGLERSGISAWRCQHPLSRNRRLAGIKHLNRLDQVLGSAELPESVQEGLMFDDQGFLIEGTRSNVFLVHQGRLLTPALTESGVAGILRAEILQLAASIGLETSCQPIDQTTLLQADELLVCNSVLGIWPVTTLYGAAASGLTEAVLLGRWPVGPITRQLQQQLQWGTS